MDKFIYPRAVSQTLAERLSTMPVVVVTGARQTGKTTLVRDLSNHERQFLSLDDYDVRDLLRRNPESLFDSQTDVTVDEVQRDPSTLLAIKKVVDGHRRSGNFLLTGSANLLLMKNVADSLAGRASYIHLWPMTRRELDGQGTCGIWNLLLDTPDDGWKDILDKQEIVSQDWRALASRGGFPEPSLHLRTDAERSIWFEGFIRTYLERDLQDLAAVASLIDFRRLIQAICIRLGQTLNQSKVSRNLALPQATIHRHLNLLETSHLLVRIPAYTVNRTKRLMKAPKLYWCDTGLALYISGVPPSGAALENMVLNDLLVWRDSSVKNSEIFHWRTTTGVEVDFVIETSDGLLPIEIKTTSNPRLRDVNNLIAFRTEYSENSRNGLLLHTGDAIDWIAPNILAAPLWTVI